MGSVPYLPPVLDGSDWIDEVWLGVIGAARGLSARPEPTWYSLPALSRVSATNAHVLRAFNGLNSGRPYADQVKPANFLLLAHDDPLVVVPAGLDRGRLTLIAPYSSSPAMWLSLPYRNRFDGNPVPVTTEPGGRPGAVRIKTYRDVVDEYVRHPEGKSSASAGGVCTRSTTGLLGRLSVRAARVRHIGKESHHLEEVETGLLRTTEDPVREYLDERGEWELVRASLRGAGVPLVSRLSGMAPRTVRSRLNSGRMPQRRDRAALIDLAERLERRDADTGGELARDESTRTPASSKDGA